MDPPPDEGQGAGGAAADATTGTESSGNAAEGGEDAVGKQLLPRAVAERTGEEAPVAEQRPGGPNEPPGEAAPPQEPAATPSAAPGSGAAPAAQPSGTSSVRAGGAGGTDGLPARGLSRDGSPPAAVPSAPPPATAPAPTTTVPTAPAAAAADGAVVKPPRPTKTIDTHPFSRGSVIEVRHVKRTAELRGGSSGATVEDDDSVSDWFDSDSEDGGNNDGVYLCDIIDRAAVHPHLENGHPDQSFRYYVHYRTLNRRMDEWIPAERVVSPPSVGNARV